MRLFLLLAGRLAAMVALRRDAQGIGGGGAARLALQIHRFDRTNGLSDLPQRRHFIEPFPDYGKRLPRRFSRRGCGSGISAGLVSSSLGRPGRRRLCHGESAADFPHRRAVPFGQGLDLHALVGVVPDRRDVSG
ncbi:hypothetical protein [Azospirillum himalayense]|uniref:Secreted protein n=1 Tax=Azospirillum himalayense TaxID=654847 RepID=A0ABW0GES6_9PROT